MGRLHFKDPKTRGKYDLPWPHDIQALFLGPLWGRTQALLPSLDVYLAYSSRLQGRSQHVSLDVAKDLAYKVSFFYHAEDRFDEDKIISLTNYM